MNEALDIRSVMRLGRSEQAKAEIEPAPIQTSKPRYVKLEQDHKDLIEMRKNLKEQAERSRASECLRIKIYKAINNGEDHTDILLMALECISLMTGDRVFYEQNKRTLNEKQKLKGFGNEI